jgi:chromosome segregation ATPase
MMPRLFGNDFLAPVEIYMRDLSPEEQSRRQTEIRRTQSEMFALQSDKSRLERKQSDMTVEIRHIRTELSHLQADLEEKEASLRSLAREIELADEAAVRAKKHINSL